MIIELRTSTADFKSRDSHRKANSTTQNLTLTSTLPPKLNQSYPGQEIIFTCVIVTLVVGDPNNSGIQLAWSSDDYIGSGGTRLELFSHESIGSQQTSPVIQSTVATLFNVSNKDGSQRVESQLRIYADQNKTNNTITCHEDTFRELNKSIKFRIIRKFIIVTHFTNSYHLKSCQYGSSGKENNMYLCVF